MAFLAFRMTFLADTAQNVKAVAVFPRKRGAPAPLEGAGGAAGGDDLLLPGAAQPEGQARQDQLALRGGTSIPAMLGYFVACLLLSGALLLLGLDPTAVSALFAM